MNFPQFQAYFALRICLAGFDDLGAAASIQLKAVRLAFIGDFALADLKVIRLRLEAANEVGRGRVTHRDVLERDDAARLLISRVFEVVQAVVIEDEPPPLPALVAPALLP